FQKALSLNPGIDAAWFNLGHALRDAGDLEGSLDAYKIYLKTHPHDAEVFSLIGDVYMEMNLDDEAMDAFEMALMYDPSRAGTLSNIAVIVRDKGWHHAALTIMTRARAIDPEDHDIRRSHGTLSLM